MPPLELSSAGVDSSFRKQRGGEVELKDNNNNNNNNNSNSNSNSNSNNRYRENKASMNSPPPSFDKSQK